MKLKGIGEDRIIKELARKFSREHPRLVKGIGDDASVTLQASGRHLLATTDMLIEGTHFKRAWTTPYLLGRKALSISLSDIAAMGGEPLFYLVSVALPLEIATQKTFLEGLYRGLTDCGKEYGATLSGGNTARTKGAVMVSTTLFGESPVGETVYRSKARPGDIIYVTGCLGDAALGLKLLKKHGSAALKKQAFRKPVMKLLDPLPRMKIGRSLARKQLATAMIDISDGLVLDLGRLCEASAVGAVIDAKRIPLSAEFKRLLPAAGMTGKFRLALTGGEDYELLFSAQEKAAKKIMALSSRNVLITPIGMITSGKGVCVSGMNNRPLKISKAGFEHF